MRARVTALPVDIPPRLLVLDVADLPVFRPDGVAHDRGRRLEVRVATVSGAGQALGQDSTRLHRAH